MRVLPDPSGSHTFFHLPRQHIIAKQHVGETDDPAQLALACNRCNAHKGPNLSSVDPESQEIVPLFNPRQDSWEAQFMLHGGNVSGLTPIGRVTVQLLKRNSAYRVELRQEWLKDDV